MALRAGGFSALIVVGMTVLGVAVLFCSFYVYLNVDAPGSVRITECKLPFCHFVHSVLVHFSTDVSRRICFLVGLASSFGKCTGSCNHMSRVEFTLSGYLFYNQG